MTSNKKQLYRFVLIAFFLVFVFTSAISGVTDVATALTGDNIIYVDNALSTDCLGNYSVVNRNCSGSDGYAYVTIQSAVNNMSVGDHVLLREGTYTECVDIPTSKNGTSWDAGNYNKIASYTGEWAVIDGNNACTTLNNTLLGHAAEDASGASDLKYWVFERLELKNGGFAGESNGPAIWVNGGPFKIRYCYIHDNGGKTSSCDYASTATMGSGWRNSIIEYNYFENNGAVSTNDNCKQISWIENYTLTDNIERYGVSIDRTTGMATSNGISRITTMGNTIRYNYVNGGTVGIAPKHFVWRTGRDTSNSTYSDTYKDLGTKIHHNIVANTENYAIGAHGDFDQIYNNIMDSTGFGICSMYNTWTSAASGGYTFHYKVVVYNNTAINISHGGVYTGRGNKTEDWMDNRVFVYLYNNLDDGNSSYNNYSIEGGITPKMRTNVEPALDYSNVKISNNYRYRPGDSVDYRIDRVSYDTSGFENQTVTLAPRVGYTNTYNSENLLYSGLTGASKYITRGSHIIKGTKTIGNGGIGGPHPYLDGITIPSYIGATNPDDNAWVDGILTDVTDIDWLKMQGEGDPSWIEGSSQTNTVPTIRADVDNNSQINSTDAMLTLRDSVGLDMSGTNWQSSSTTGDADCDGDTDSTDAMLILRDSLGLGMSGTGWCVD